MLLLFVTAICAADDDGERQVTIKEQELEQVRERIADLKADLDRNARDRDRLTTDLQAAEVRIAETRTRLADLERQRDYSERRAADLTSEIDAGEAELDAEMSRLSSQVRAAYMSGGQEKIRLLLNQQDPATVGRVFAYYDYLNRYRADNIGRVRELLAQLEGLRSEVATEVARLTELSQAQHRELTALNEAQTERRELLATLDARIEDQSSEIDRLAAEERDLKRLIDELVTILSDYPIRAEEPFESYRGRLTWPVAGALQHDFGQPRVGGRLTWNGVVLRAPRGREVRAVYHGRVIFADWLAGMGLLIIVDHGDGYLTLYGYNETLLKDSGDWVAPGDVIATVGDSGGQSEPSLYFEVRRGTTPLDPGNWTTRRPGASP